MKRCLSVLLTLLAVASFFAPSSQADQFAVKQCAGAEVLDFGGQYSPLGGNRVDVLSGCNAPGATKLGVYQNRNNQRMNYGDGGQFLWYTTNGNQIVSTAIQSKLNTKNGVAARLIGSSPSNSDVALDVGSDHTGDSVLSRWSNPADPVTVVSARLMCGSSSGCENNSNSQKAFLEVTDADFTVRDTQPPTFEASGQLKDWSGNYAWRHGSIGYTIEGADQGSGVSKTFLMVNGSRLDAAGASCPGAQPTYATRFNPCPGSFVHSGQVDTAISPFQEGVNLIQFCVEDFSISASSGAPVCSEQRGIPIDNRPPEAPGSLGVVGGSDWRSSNDFDLSWINPGGQMGPIVAAEYSIFDDQHHLVAGPTAVFGNSIQSLDSLQVPGPGTFTASVRLFDYAGNVGPTSSTALRFDDGRPSNVAPEPTDGWISSDELPFHQTIERADSGGPSGIDGYAVKVSQTGPDSPCPSGTCGSADLSLSNGADARTVTIPDMSEGDHWISSVAASGAGLASEQPEAIELHVDKTDPVTSIEGVPASWVSRPVTLTARATDESSGMTPATGGDPVTVIEPAGQSPYVSPGGTAKFTIATEGVTTVRYWARDFAGNANDGGIAPDGDRHRPPDSIAIRIDTAAPSVAFRAGSDLSEPEKIVASVHDRDSGVMEGRILFRKAGSTNEFQELGTKLLDGVMTAQLPSDDLEKASYELKAEAIDWAGNSSEPNWMNQDHPRSSQSR